MPIISGLPTTQAPQFPEGTKGQYLTYDDNGNVIATDAPSAAAEISTHNTATDTHSDIRLLVSGLTDRLNALANSDDTTLDQMAEVVAYIKSNKSLIDAITTNKVSVSDIINNLTTNVDNKPLSAAQGVALKALIDAIVVPTKTSELTNDSGFTSTKFYDKTLSTNWTEDEETGVKIQRVSVEGFTSANSAKIYPRYTGDGTNESYATFVEQQNQFFEFITNGYGETFDGYFEIYIFGDPNTVSIPITVEVI